MALRAYLTRTPANGCGAPHVGRAMGAAVGLAALVCVAGCPVTFEQTLPADMDGTLRYVFDHKAAFAEPDPPPGGVGTPVDPLAGVVGCWGSYAPDAARGEEPVRIDVYMVCQFEADGRATSWTLTNIGGLYAMVFTSEGRYEIVGPDRLRIVEEQTRVYNPASADYEVFPNDPPSVIEYFATAAGDELRLWMIEGDDDSTERADMVFQRMDCEP